jgi:hypothetical protein
VCPISGLPEIVVHNSDKPDRETAPGIFLASGSDEIAPLDLSDSEPA